MTEKEIKEFLFSDPEKFFKYFENKGISLDFIKDQELHKRLVVRRYGKDFKEEFFEAADVVLWVAYFCERNLTESIKKIEIKSGRKLDEVENWLDGITFGQKITFVNDNYNQSGSSDKHIIMLREVKKLRNHLAHGRIDKLIYKGYMLNEVKGQALLIVDIANAALNR